MHELAGPALRADAPAEAGVNSIRVVHTTLGEVLRSRLLPGTVPNGRLMTVQLPRTTPLAAMKQQLHGTGGGAPVPATMPVGTAVPMS